MSAIAASAVRPGTLRLPVTRGLLYLLILSFPFFSIKPEIFRPDWWIGGALILVFVFSVLARGRFQLDPIGYAVLGFNAAVLMSTAVNFWGWKAAQWSEFLTLWLQLVFATLLYLGLANLSLSVPQLRSLLRFWISVAMVVALYGLYQVLARNLDLPLAYLPYLHSEPSPWQLEWGLGFGGYVRPSSVLREPTYLGRYLLAPLLIVATLVLLKADRAWLFNSRKLNYFTLFILAAAVIASFALATWTTMAALLSLFALLGYGSRRLTMKLAFVFAFSFALLVVGFQVFDIPLLSGVLARLGQLPSNIMTLSGTSIGTRLQEAILALDVWLHNPVVGVGLNQMQFTGQFYAPEYVIPWVAERGYIHNIWLEVAVQAGLLGLLFFGLMWLRALRMMRGVFRHSSGSLRWVGLAFFYVLLATMINGNEGGPFTFLLYWFYLGLASAVYKLTGREEG